MPDISQNKFMSKLCAALGRAEPPRLATKPPIIDDRILRMIQRDANLREKFLKSAADSHFQIEVCGESDVAQKISEFLKSKDCKRIGMASSPRIEAIKLYDTLQSSGFTVSRWNELTLDSAYELDCGITDVFAAVAETGSLAIRPDPAHGRALSLLPPLHIAIVQANQLVADLVDLMDTLHRQGQPKPVTLITGPSKTADIEGALVTGVHGPGVVKIYFLGDA